MKIENQTAETQLGQERYSSLVTFRPKAARQGAMEKALTRMLSEGCSSSTAREIAEILCQEMQAAGVEIATTAANEKIRVGGTMSGDAECFPLRASGRSFGSLQVWGRGQGVDSERVRYVAEVMAAAIERQQLLEDVSRFIHSATHDLRAIFVRGYSMVQLLERNQERPEEDLELLRSINKNLAKGESLLRDFAALADVSSNDEPPSAISVNGLFETIRWNTKAALAKAGVTITFSSTDQEVLVREAQIIDAVERLIDNSRKFGATAIVVQAMPQGDGVEVTISDNGPGIEEEFSDQVFRPLERLHGDTIPGNGMGLAIARKVIAMHGGSIWIANPSKYGAEVKIWLPVVTFGHR